MMRRGTEAAVIVGLTALDQATKLATAHRTIGMIPGVIRLNYTENRGFSLGLFDGAVSVALILSLIVFAGLLAVLIRLPRGARIRLPLLCIGQEVVWAIGVGPSESARVAGGTDAVLIEYRGFLPFDAGTPFPNTDTKGVDDQ